MEKKRMPFLFYFIWTFAIPFAGAAMFNIIFCLLQKNYYYVPYGLDFMIQLSYDAMYLFLFASLFFSTGTLVYSIAFCRAKDAVGTALTGILSMITIPLLMYLIRMIFLSGEASDATMESYFYSDSLCAIENASRYLVALIVAAAVRAFYFIKKETPEFKKPYFLPSGAAQLALLIFYISWLIIALISFIISETHEFGALVYEIVLAVAGYALSITALLACNKKLNKK